MLTPTSRPIANVSAQRHVLSGRYVLVDPAVVGLGTHHELVGVGHSVRSAG